MIIYKLEQESLNILKQSRQPWSVRAPLPLAGQPPDLLDRRALAGERSSARPSALLARSRCATPWL